MHNNLDENNNSEDNNDKDINEKTDKQNSTRDNSVSFPNRPSTILIGEDDNSKNNLTVDSNEENKIYENLAKYGITKDEWAEIEKYKGSFYFIPTTILHGIDLYRYNTPMFSSIFGELNELDPKSLLEKYTKIYSAMCKFGKRDNKKRNIYRIGFDDFYNEMNNSNQTESFLSFSENGYKYDFFWGKKNPVFVKGILEKGTPCIDFSKITGGDSEEEILIPPFLNITYNKTNSFIEGAFPEIETYISKGRELSNITREEIEELEKSVLNSDIPNEYYSHWYNTFRTNPLATGNDEESLKLKNEFFNWQSDFKKILQYRFKEIEKEIEYPKVVPCDFLRWAISKVEDRKSLKLKIQKVCKFFEKNTKKINEKDR